MAEVVNVVQINEDDTGFVFEVSIGELKYKVTLTREYYEKLTNGKITETELIKKSFEFLLEREPANSILPEFDLPLINKYFPEYEEVIASLGPAR